MPVITEFSIRSPRARAVRSLRGLLEAGGLRRGDRLPAETKLAAQFKVSRMTLRSAMDELEREGLIWRERNQGCFFGAAQLDDEAGKTANGLISRTIVLVSDHDPVSDGNNFSGNSRAIVSGVIDRASRSKQDFLRMAIDRDSDGWIDELVESRVRGVVLSCWEQPVEWQLNVLRKLSKHGIPVVTWDESDLLADFDRVGTDHVSGAEQLVTALADAGCRNILRLWTQPPETPWIRAHNMGYERAVRSGGQGGGLSRGLNPIEPVYVEGLAPRTVTEQNFRIRVRSFAGYLAEHLGSHRAVDAIMVCTDCEAFVALAACRLFGREDVLVTGYDNYWQGLPECGWEPAVPFATVDKSNHRLGEAMVEMLMQRIAGELPAAPQRRLIQQQLVPTR